MIGILVSLVCGAILSFTGIALHNFLPPLGLILALLVSGLGIHLIGSKFGSRTYKFWALLTWLLVFVRAGTRGTSYELLIYANVWGNIYLITAILTVVIVALRKVR